MSVVLSMEEVGPCRKQLRIEVPQPAVAAEMARVTGEYGKRARIPGFRKGKVPPAMVAKHFGKEIEQEVLERLLPRYWKQAAAEKSLDPLAPPAVENVELKPDAPLLFTAVVEVRPEIELRNFRDFALPEADTEATREEIERAVADLRRSHADWTPVERTAAIGDVVRVELVEAGAADPTPQAAEFELGSDRVWEEVSSAATGLAAGQSASFARKEGEGESATERQFELRVVEVREARLPELTPEFLGHFGKFESAEAFEADVARRIAAAKRDELRARREQTMLDQLVERHPMELPEGVVHRETEELLREYAEGLARRGVDLEKAEIDWQSMGDQARPHAERRIKARLILDRISESEKVEVGQVEFEEALALLARMQNVPTQALRQRLDQSGELAGLRARMRREKTVRFLLGEPAGAAPDAAAAD
ncbi:MAG: trigger factor [Thermoanaerobaculia bacterium]|nr:MAG: trigger factor [Thermoanaerobaculia bacterium]MBZ0100629.1 trigger factor [Thermoanaerobaculia bacterium]